MTAQQPASSQDEEYQKILETKRMQEMMKAELRKVVDDAAFDRMTNVLAIKPQLFQLAAQQIISLAHRTNRTLSDAEVLKILKLLKGMKERRTNIQIKHK